MKDAVHNAHLLIPKKLYDRAKRAAQRSGQTVTSAVVEGLELWLHTKAPKKRRAS